SPGRGSRAASRSRRAARSRAGISRRRALLGVVAGLAAAGCSWVPLDGLIFHPDRAVPDPPPGTEERTITTADGLRLHAWYGGAVAIRLATVRACAGVAVVSTFTSLRDAGRAHYGPLAVLAGNRFDSLARVRELSVPLFVAHDDRDEIVPFVLGERLFAAARE